MARELHLLAFGNTRSAGPWRYPAVDNTTAGVRRTLVERARTAEAGTFDALFFADGLNYGPPATWTYKTTEDFEPLTTAQAVGGHRAGGIRRHRIGDAGTPVPPGAPTAVARPLERRSGRLGSGDQLRAGRRGELQRRRRGRPRRAVPHRRGGDRGRPETVGQLGRRHHRRGPCKRGIFNDVNKIDVPDHHGRYFDVAGPLGAARSVQGQPVIFQADSSATCRAFAARALRRHLHQPCHPAERAQVLRTDPRRGDPDRAAPNPGDHTLATVRRWLHRGRGPPRRAQRLRLLQPGVPGGWLPEVDLDVTGADLDVLFADGVPGRHRDAPDGAGRLPRPGR